MIKTFARRGQFQRSASSGAPHTLMGSTVCVGAGDSAAGAAVHELRRPLGTLHGVVEAA